MTKTRQIALLLSLPLLSTGALQATGIVQRGAANTRPPQVLADARLDTQSRSDDDIALEMTLHAAVARPSPWQWSAVHRIGEEK